MSDSRLHETIKRAGSTLGTAAGGAALLWAIGAVLTGGGSAEAAQLAPMRPDSGNPNISTPKKPAKTTKPAPKPKPSPSPKPRNTPQLTTTQEYAPKGTARKAVAHRQETAHRMPSSPQRTSPVISAGAAEHKNKPKTITELAKHGSGVRVNVDQYGNARIAMWSRGQKPRFSTQTLSDKRARVQLPALGRGKNRVTVNMDKIGDAAYAVRSGVGRTIQSSSGGEQQETGQAFGRRGATLYINVNQDRNGKTTGTQRWTRGYARNGEAKDASVTNAFDQYFGGEYAVARTNKKGTTNFSVGAKGSWGNLPTRADAGDYGPHHGAEVALAIAPNNGRGFAMVGSVDKTSRKWRWHPETY